ncbi:DUF1648 domain-containing protein [Lactiplantibacillus paraplantarum]|uniref:DUF1648 domain-containing protein n=1 Tax=Lactiplantibacillus paraplantarum TaxID=60520 RepID=A0A4Q9Y189_9LACO|nr:DUF1648 domain-containing protein [Lactiplantibacillus paraplantarum]
MRVFTWIVRAIAGTAVLMCVIMIGLAPQTVVTHFNHAGLADSFGSGWWLVMLPLLVVVMGEVIIKLARQKRRKLGLLQLPTLTVFEGQCLGVMVSFSVLLWLFMQSEVQGRLVSGMVR